MWESEGELDSLETKRERQLKLFESALRVDECKWELEVKLRERLNYCELWSLTNILASLNVMRKREKWRSKSWTYSRNPKQTTRVHEGARELAIKDNESFTWAQLQVSNFIITDNSKLYVRTSTISGLSSGFGVRHLNGSKFEVITKTGSILRTVAPGKIRNDETKNIHSLFTIIWTEVYKQLYLVTVSDILLEYWPGGIGSYWASTICKRKRDKI